MWGIGAAVVGGAVLITIVVVLVFALKLTSQLVEFIVNVVQAIGRTATALIRDIIIAAACTVRATALAVGAVVAMLCGRWPVAKRLGKQLREQLARAGRRLSDLPTRAASRGQRTPVTRSTTADDDPDHFPGWEIVDELKAGGSGARLLVATPLPGNPHNVDRAVIKVFNLSSGSPLPQMMRESRALDGARKMGMVLEHGMDEQRFWYAMPFIPGDNLSVTAGALHRDDAPVAQEDLRRILMWMRDLIGQLEAYHDAGLWHKDVKPDNVIVNATGAHLVDFGLVTPLGSAMTLTTHGTEFFRDPELVRQAYRGSKVSDVDGARFDIYSLGAVLYFMVEGTFPAHGNLSRFSKACPPAVQMIVRRAMADYDKRYTKIATMGKDVQQVIAAHDIAAVRPADLPSMALGAAAGQEDEARHEHVKRLPPRNTGPFKPRPRSLWQIRSAMHAARREDRKAVRVARRSEKPTQLGGGGAFVMGAIVLAFAMMALSTMRDDVTDVTTPTVERIEIDPIASGKAIVINELAGAPAAGDELEDRLSAWGWHPVQDAQTEATFRKALPAAGPASDEFVGSATAALDQLGLDAAFVLHNEDGEAASVLMLSAEGERSVQLSTLQ
ncbi:MAG: hypothetical protein MK074_08670 [Phycisphaerales bacterium]|nr:hypothetical protein [Phycisphaerales bacterium]